MQRIADLVVRGARLAERHPHGERAVFRLKLVLVPLGSGSTRVGLLPGGARVVAGQAAIADGVPERELCDRGWLAQDLQKLALRIDVCAPTFLLYRLREAIEAEALRDGDSRLPDDLGELLVGQVSPLLQPLEALRLLDGVQVFALEILDEGDLGGVVILANKRRDFGEAGGWRLASASRRRSA